MDNTRDTHPNLYQRISSYFHGVTARCIGVERCGYCNEQFDGAELTLISIKNREKWVCQKCRAEMKTFKVTDQ
jgi:hypothetical protein